MSKNEKTAEQFSRLELIQLGRVLKWCKAKTEEAIANSDDAFTVSFAKNETLPFVEEILAKIDEMF